MGVQANNLEATLRYISRNWDNVWLAYIIECSLNNDFEWMKED